MKLITVVHCWSAPRSRSTAFLYSWEARGDDCVAMDEPLYR
jgi:protein-lysine N-methyltransferase EEF2KMT